MKEKFRIQVKFPILTKQEYNINFKKVGLQYM